MTKEKNFILGLMTILIVPVLAHAGAWSKLRDKVTKPVKKIVKESGIEEFVGIVTDAIPILPGSGGVAPRGSLPNCGEPVRNPGPLGSKFNGIGGWNFGIDGTSTVLISSGVVARCFALVKNNPEIAPELYCKKEKNNWERSREVVRELLAVHVGVTGGAIVYNSGWGYLIAAGSTMALEHNCDILQKRIRALDSCSTNALNNDEKNFIESENETSEELSEIERLIDGINAECDARASAIVLEYQGDPEAGAQILVELRKECDEKILLIKSVAGESQ